MDDKVLAKIQQEISDKISLLKKRGAYSPKIFMDIRNAVLNLNLSLNDPEYDSYKSAVSSYFGRRGGHAAATLRNKKYSALDKKRILEEIWKEERMEGAQEAQKILCGEGIH